MTRDLEVFEDFGPVGPALDGQFGDEIVVFLVGVDFHRLEKLMVFGEVVEEGLLGELGPGVGEVFSESEVLELVFGQKEVGQVLQVVVGDAAQVDGFYRLILV